MGPQPPITRPGLSFDGVMFEKFFSFLGLTDMFDSEPESLFMALIFLGGSLFVSVAVFVVGFWLARKLVRRLTTAVTRDAIKARARRFLRETLISDDDRRKARAAWNRARDEAYGRKYRPGLAPRRKGGYRGARRGGGGGGGYRRRY